MKYICDWKNCNEEYWKVASVRAAWRTSTGKEEGGQEGVSELSAPEEEG